MVKLMKNNKYSSLLFYSFLSIALVMSFLGGSFSNTAYYQQAANLINKEHSRSGVKNVAIYAKYSDKTYDYDSMQSKIHSIVERGWPNNTFKIMPIYNIDDTIGLRMEEDSKPLFIIPNNNWETHISTSGTGNTLGSYDLSLINLESINDKGEYDNFCFIPDTMSNRINKTIGDIITIKYNDYSFNYIIRNIINSGISTAAGIEETYGDNYILANQDDIELKIQKQLCLCRYFANNKTSLLNIVEFKQMVSSNTEFVFQHLYKDKTIERYSFKYEKDITNILNRNLGTFLWVTISFFFCSFLLFGFSIFVFDKKIINSISRNNVLIIAGIFIVTLIVFGAIALFAQNIRYFSLFSLISYMVFLFFYIFSITKKYFEKKKKPYPIK